MLIWLLALIAWYKQAGTYSASLSVRPAFAIISIQRFIAFTILAFENHIFGACFMSNFRLLISVVESVFF
nr:MAG TPA: hypothetical protein [Caudoviricetes sp.]DAL69039.1 MAG TPA: hypothetical protein [Caudoviricetes sp.]DAZ27647.1 MAG TPA: hypothetical protein [Caudoviricetes sp.]